MRYLWALMGLCMLLTWGCKDSGKSGIDESTDLDSETDTTSDGGTDSDTGTGIESSELYTVTVNGTDIPVLRMDRFDRVVQFARFDLDAASTVEISLGAAVPDFQLSPVRLGIETTTDGDTITFTASEPAYLVLSPDEMERLFILIDPPETAAPGPSGARVTNVADLAGMDNSGETLVTESLQAAIDAASGADKNIVYVPAGTYQVGELWMRDNMTLYLADGAMLKASTTLADIVTDNTDGSSIEQCLHAIIRMNGVTNSHLAGRGMIDAGGTYLRDKNIAETKYNLLKIEDSSDCTVDGITSIDSSFWNTIIYRSDNVQLTNYKIVNHRKATGWNETDGVDFDNSTNSTLSNAFIYVGDDCMATKSDDIADDYVYPEGVTNYPPDPTTGDYISVDNVVHENVVCMTNQAALKIGTKTMGADMGNVVFRDMDVLKCGRGLVIDAMDTARVHDITFENVVFEYVTPFDAVDFGINEGTFWRYSEGTGQVEDIIVNNIVYNDFQLRPVFRVRGRQGEAVAVDTDTDTATDAATDTDNIVDGYRIYPFGAVTFTNVMVNGSHVTDADYEDHINPDFLYADQVTFQ